jgi:porin
MNLAFNINPVTLVSVPYSTLGAGIIMLPTQDPHEAVVSFMALAADGQPNSSGFDDVGNGNNVLAAEGRVRTGFYGLTGHQLVGGTYSTKTFTSLDQRLRSIIENRGIEKNDGTWSLYYNFDQYLYEAKKGSGKGLGIFGRLGLSDGNPNPMHYFYSIGFGGKGVIPNRPLDSFGLGYYYITINQPTFTGPLRTRKFFRDEQGLEAYYNAAITPWMILTPDIQFVKGAQQYALSPTTGLPLQLEDINTATVAGIRLQVIF